MCHLLALANSHLINQYRIDHTPEIEAARQKNTQPDSEEQAETYSYRNRKKVDRQKSKQPDPEEQAVKKLRPDAYHRIHRIDKITLFCTRFLVWLAAFLVILDYLKRLNSTFDCYFPLPLASRALDAIAPKTPAGWGQEEQVKQFLENTVRKGETFILFTEEDSLPQDTLPRISVRGIPLLSLKKITCSSENMPFDNDYIFESAWFNRYCFVIEGSDIAQKTLDDLIEFLSTRRTVFARARKTVNIVWALETTLEKDEIEELSFLCKETNYRLINVQP